MNFVKRFALVLLVAGLVASGMYALSGHVFAGETRNGVAASPADTALANPTRGVIFGTAGVNADGTIASCFNCNASITEHLATGEYQVGFQNFGMGNITANNGYSRWVQVDTLGTGSSNAWCTTADRAGVVGAVYVLCQQEGGSGSMGNSVAVDVSFFLFVAR